MSPSKSSKSLFRKGSDLTIHPFASLVLKNTRLPRTGLARIRFIMRLAVGLEPEFKNLKEPPDTWDIPSFGEETEEEKYHQNISDYLIALTELIDRLEAVQIYLSFTSFLSKKMNDNQISVEEWINYHYSNHVLTTLSVYDTALCLFNATAQLNIKQSSGFDENVRNKIKGHNEYEDTKSALDNIKSKIDQNRTPRNLFVHSGENPSHDALTLINIVEIYNIGSRYSDNGNEETTQKRKEWANREAANRLKNELEKETDDIYHLLLALFSALQPIYEQNLENHKQTSSKTS